MQLQSITVSAGVQICTLCRVQYCMILCVNNTTLFATHARFGRPVPPTSRWKESNKMDVGTLENLTDSDKDLLAKVSSTIRKERAISRAHKSQLDNISLVYQAQIAALSKERKELLTTSQGSSDKRAWLGIKLDEARQEVQEQNDKQISKLQGDVASVQGSLKKIETEKVATEQILSRVREAAAADANLISQLREELNQLRENKEHAVAESVEKHVRNMQLLRQSKEADSKVIKYEESNVLLKSEVKRLTAELVQTRTQMDSMSASNAAAMSSGNKVNMELSNNLAAANLRAQKLTTELANVERHIIDLQADFDREKCDQRAQIENLSKLVEMHREATKDAEIRLAGYTELLGTLAKETKDAEDRPARKGPPALDRHAEVLFKSLNQALDTKLQVLENERHELIRARATEARMETKQQALLRETAIAKAEAEEARRQMILLETELDTQKDKVAQLQRQLMFNGSMGGFQSPSVIPFTETRGSGFAMSTPGSGSGRRLPVQTPSPIRHGVNLESAEQALADMVEIRRRHEALLHGLKGRRDEYGELMND